MQKTLRQTVEGFQTVKALWMKGKVKPADNKDWWWLETASDSVKLHTLAPQKADVSAQVGCKLCAVSQHCFHSQGFADTHFGLK